MPLGETPGTAPPGWQAITLTRAQTEALLDALADLANLPTVTAEDDALLRRLDTTTATALRLVTPLLTWRRFLIGSRRRAEAAAGVDELLALHARLPALRERMLTLETPTGELERTGLRAEDLLDPRWGLAAALADLGAVHLLPAGQVAELPRALADLDAAVAAEAPLRERVLAAALALRRPQAEQRLRTLPLAELRQVTTERLRLETLEDAGIGTVHDLLRQRDKLRRIDGIGPKTADVLRTAAVDLERLTLADVPVRLDVERRDPATTRLVSALVAWDAVRRTKGAGEDLARADGLRALAGVLHDDVAHVLLLGAPGLPASAPVASVQAVVRRADRVAATEPTPPVEVGDPWSEVVRRPADLYAALAEIGVLSEGADAAARAAGELPPGLVDTVRGQELRTDDLRVALRGYQAFAARFALVQRRVVIGDEMGLGKTIEALAVLAHLWTTGAQRFLVVCPAAVVTNWVREVTGRSTVPVHRVHGRDADEAYAAWLSDGGLAVTTFETLAWRMADFDRDVAQLDCVVVDEAHYVKNPDTARAHACVAQLAKADRAVLLTGTPMENHVDEFRTLLGYLRPDLAAGTVDLAPRAFRQHVAPAYLRRNVEDVLSELPELVVTDEWLELSETDEKTYAAAVAAGSFAAMRRAAMLGGARSAKVQRLVELVAEAEDNDRRVVVFSYFREVLEEITGHLAALGEPTFGPLTGQVDPDTRQHMIDDFSVAEHGAVLLAQITTGGVGLNIQAASVVIICEPQLKPTTEAQAVARAHRMGQLRSVQVHRLLTLDSVDERICEILAVKQQQFDDFVRASETAAAAPEALDVAEADLGRRVVAAERARLLYAPPPVPTPDD
ncbi:DEAD/DEAH box helicase [Nocardioides sp. zg-536]|uniref:DEAD/DEAH box helicase n=1 Tax=Nocardioides faecalis TaxID=2803858 RepID=A0A938Y7T1_9ACTN|nr:DEAD/DEAH box helicase [Nocardioides faecalis]MBM9460777.1 DEAD/DEAH box helicase [Nocardioides faecalis]MBS4752716.1 DEAD/DEAH box helicase [Nocardioides faecalis]QVI57970.1 DEAD/DEAH box helicase [Nocardioides faecalis]